jgi:hypothetical protein
MPAVSKTSTRTLTDIANDIRERALQQQCVAAMLRAMFYACADPDNELRRRIDDVWEGLAVIAAHIEQDGGAISGMVDEILYDRDRSATKGGG